MKRRLLLICITILLAAVAVPTAGVFADADHPITMFIQIDPDPEMETGGTIPDMLFTIRNSGDTDYTLEHAELSGGFEDRTLTLDEHITVLAGGTKEFHLTDVVISDEQLDRDVVYRLSWKETESIEDPESGALIDVVHDRETEATVRIERFVPPELTVTASASSERVRAGETFTVTYTITNDTKYDMSGLRLYDPEQSMQSIGLKSSELYAGDTRSVEVTYTMGKNDMKFAPVIEYTVRQRELTTEIETPLIVESVVVDVTITVEQYPTTNEGTTFAVTIFNAGNRAVTNIQLFDEINTKIDEPFDLAPEQSKVLMYTVPSAISSGRIRTIRFHLTAVDCLETVFTVTDPNSYEAVPYVDSDDVKIGLYVVLQRAYYDENGKLCGSIQFEVRNFSKVSLHSAKLTELRIFGDLKSYEELQNGETYFVTSLQLDGIPELVFRVDAYDPAGMQYHTDEVRLDLSRLKELADQSDNPIYVTPHNPFFRNLAAKYSSLFRVIAAAALIVAAVCALVCIVLYAVERRIKAKLPPAFEENMEGAMQKTKRRLEPQIFRDAATEQFGYTVPIKLRNYGELTEQEAEARRNEYQQKLQENLREYSASPAAISKKRVQEQQKTPDPAFSGTRIVPVVRPASQAPVREDIRIIPIDPVETKSSQAKQEPRKPQVQEPQKPAKAAQKVKQHPIQKPSKKPIEQKTMVQKTVKPVERTVPKPEPKSEDAAPVIPVVSQQPTGRFDPVREKPIVQASVERPTPKEEKPAAIPTEPIAPKPIVPVTKPTVESKPEQPIPQPPVPEGPAVEPVIEQRSTDLERIETPEPAFEPHAPRIQKLTEQPARRPIGELRLKHMNG